MVKLIGFYSELDPHKPNVYSGSIMDAIGDSPGPYEEEVARYLEEGAVLLDIMEAGRDVVTGDQYITGCSSVLTDGEWVWRLDFPYYLRRYHLKLEDEFFNHASSLSFNMPRLSRDEIVSVARYVAFELLGMR